MTARTDSAPNPLVAGDRELRQQWVEEARGAGDVDHFAGKRRQERTTWFPQLEVRVPGRPGPTQTYLASGHDISEGGLRFFCRRPIDRYTNVEVVVEGEEQGVVVHVAHCTRTFNGYLVGADFVD